MKLDNKFHVISMFSKKDIDVIHQKHIPDCRINDMRNKGISPAYSHIPYSQQGLNSFYYKPCNSRKQRLYGY